MGSYRKAYRADFHPSNIGRKKKKEREHAPAVRGDFVNRCFKTEKLGGQEECVKEEATNAKFQE